MAFPVILIQIGIQVGLWAINRYLLRDDEPRLPKPKPEGLEFANTTIGTPHPYVAGTVRIDNPVMVWNGNHRAWRDATGRYVYETEMLLAIGVPIWEEATAPWSSWRTTSRPRLCRFWYGDSERPALVNATHGTQKVVQINLSAEDTFRATLEFFDGRPTQTLVGKVTHTAITSSGISSAHVPGYRHKMLCSVLASTRVIGQIGYNPRIPAMGFEVSSLGPEPIGLDANPAWVLYDLLCRPVWGLGYDPDDVDLASFEAAADTLVTEEHGCSIAIHRVEDAASVFAGILSQIDAVCFEAPSTGKMKLKLIRAVSPVGLPELTVDNTIGRPEIDWTSERATVNEVRCAFTDRSRFYKPDSVPAQKLANAAARDNRRRPMDFNAPGCMNATLAAKIAARELAVMGRPLLIVKATVNREFYDLELGDVVEANWAQYQITTKFFRVAEVDPGQRADGAIKLVLVEDVFDSTAGGLPLPAPDPVPTLLPLTERLFTEAPYWLQYYAFVNGQVFSLTDQRVLGAAVEEADDATYYRCNTVNGGLLGIYGSSAFSDIALPPFPLTATVETAYPATAGPYDTTTGLRLENVTGEDAATFATLTATATEIANAGANLAIVGGELIAFESVTDLTGGVYRLDNVWRELGDTACVAHVVGERFYLLDTDLMGRRAWPVGHNARGFAIPSYRATVGSDEVNASDDIVIRGRASLALRVADFRVSGYDIDGTSGIPAVNEVYPLLGAFKALSRMEAAIDLTGRERTLERGDILRGDDATSYPAETGVTWDVYGQKVGAAEVAITGHTGLTSPTTTGVLLGEPGHGLIDVKMHTIGADSRRGWQSPAIRMTCPTWRTLLANGSGEYGALTPGWTNVLATTSVQTGTDSLSRETTGTWLQPLTGSDGVTTFSQTVDITGYLPIGLTAVATWYSRNFGGDTDDYSAVKIYALDASDATLTSATGSNTVGPTTHWRRAEVTLSLPATTAKIKVEVRCDAITDTGDVPDTGVTRVQLQVGQFGSELLTNPSFDGSIASWTNVTNSFVLNTGNPYSSRDGSIGAAQGGAFATSEIKQEIAIPAGYEYGVALLTGARSNAIADDTGEVVLELLNGGGTVINSDTTGATIYTVDQWGRFRIALQPADGAVTLRVRLLATRTLGSGNSGACFDDLSLRIHKHLDPLYEQDFDFTEPAWQPVPANWQRFHLDFPTLPVPIMVWDGSIPTPTVQPSDLLDGPIFDWSDSINHDAASFTGHWDIGPTATQPEPTGTTVHSIDAFQFVRALAASAIDVQASGADLTTGAEYGAFALTDDFSAAILFRTDELAFSTACGLMGRRGVTGVGWGIRLTAAGLPEVVLQGASSTVTAAGATSLADRAPHWVFIVNDTAASLLRIFDDRGTTSTVSTAGVGSLTSVGAVLRVGRDAPASATGGVQIARAYLWDTNITSAEAAEIWANTALPTAAPIGSFTSDRATWVVSPEDQTLIRSGINRVPIGYFGGSYGLVTTAPNTNKIPSHDFTNATYWNAETGVTLTQGIADPTGLPRGVRVTNTDPDVGIACQSITMGAGTPLTVVFWARTVDVGAAYSLDVELVDTTPAVIDTSTIVLTDAWQRFTVELGPWAASTPTAKLRFALDASIEASFDLCHVMWAAFGTDAPLAIQDATLAILDTRGTLVTGLPVQANHEGELYVTGAGSVASPPAGKTLVSIDNASDETGKRSIETATAGVPRFTLWNDAAADSNVECTAIDWSAPFEIRGRWNKLELPESLGEQIGLVVDGSVDDTTYSALAFSVGTAGLSAIRLGGGDPVGSASPNMILHRVIVRAREPKLGG